ncbi:hypothetical protein DyAD56_15780 [Dyella sp. AD56]|nr:hypothetical protein DyAD56_15780 [Dyella sp. AD56]
MAPGDALFAVRVISDGPGWIAQTWTALSPLLCVGAGSALTWWFTVGAEGKRKREEAYVLARSLAAELRAGQVVVQIHKAFYEAPDTEPGTRADTMRFGMTYDKALPVARAAAAKAGQFVTPVAEELAKFLLLSQNVTQLQEIIARMREAGALSDEKLVARSKLQAIIGATMIDCGRHLADLLDQHYPEKLA